MYISYFLFLFLPFNSRQGSIYVIHVRRYICFRYDVSVCQFHEKAKLERRRLLVTKITKKKITRYCSLLWLHFVATIIFTIKNATTSSFSTVSRTRFISILYTIDHAQWIEPRKDTSNDWTQECRNGANRSSTRIYTRVRKKYRSWYTNRYVERDYLSEVRFCWYPLEFNEAFLSLYLSLDKREVSRNWYKRKAWWLRWNINRIQFSVPRKCSLIHFPTWIIPFSVVPSITVQSIKNVTRSRVCTRRSWLIATDKNCNEFDQLREACCVLVPFRRTRRGVFLNVYEGVPEARAAINFQLE